MKPGTVVVGFLDAGHWSACFGLSYRDLCLHDMLVSQRIVREGGKELRHLTGSGGIAQGRSKIAADFLDVTDGEWLWFIDTDMGFPADIVDRLTTTADPTERPVVGALCFAQKRQKPGAHYTERFRICPTTYEYIETGDEVGFRPNLAYPRGEVIRVAGTGAACLLIHRTVLEQLRVVHGDAWFAPLTHPTGNKGKPREFSEDLSFCVRCAALDIPIHVDTSIPTCHEKGGIYLDEEAFDRQQTLADREPVAA